MQNRKMPRSLSLLMAASAFCFFPSGADATPAARDDSQQPLSVASEAPRVDVAPSISQGAPSVGTQAASSADLGVPASMEPGKAYRSEMGNSAVDQASDASPSAPETVSPECGFMACVPLLPLGDVTEYTVAIDGSSIRGLASRWGIRSKHLLELNPGFDENSTFKKGDKLVVDRRTPSTPAPISRGRSNKGRMYHARPMPEGAGFFLRDHHPNSWGSDTTVRALVTVFANYARTYPDAPAINVGDLSKKNGGRLKPHKSHQSGRDVDLGFVHTAAVAQHAKQRFTRASRSNLDVEKTWFIVEQLARTRSVEVIYVDNTVQKMLYQYAAPKLTPEQREYFFSIPRHANSSSALMRHWPGHKNHFHVRFKCPEGQTGCR